MKLIIAIVNNDDSSTVQSALTEGGFFVTKLATSGGFLKKGNTTFFVGTNDDKVDGAIEIIKANAKKRVEKEPTVPPTEMGEFFTPIMVDVLVGGATVFVVDVDRVGLVAKRQRSRANLVAPNSQSRFISVCALAFRERVQISIVIIVVIVCIS